ncbi:MAG: ABC transporter permease [Gammaproteobacteria bacterium]|nr:ABC transporter permease [Gammaproteobacteria bacterium]
MNLRGLPQRLGTSLVVCVGIAGVVAVLVSVLAMATGLTETMIKASNPHRAIVLRDGALTEALSSISREAALAVETAPGILKMADGSLAISPEIVLNVNLPGYEDAVMGAVYIRGLTQKGLEVHPEIKLTDGRWFTTGLHELVAGSMVVEQLGTLEIGDTVSFYNADWVVVGTFSSNEDAHESEMLTDAATLMSAAQRTVFNAITVELASVDEFPALETALEDNPRLKVDVQLESTYYEGQSENISQLLYLVAYVVSSIMALGALFGALNTMYSAVSVRVVEIATLRAIGFGAMPVVVSVLIEALVLALIGALVGVAIAWALFNGDTFVTGGGLRQVAVSLHVSSTLLFSGVIWACAIGFLGGLFPAIQAARQSVAQGLRVVV